MKLFKEAHKELFDKYSIVIRKDNNWEDSQKTLFQFLDEQQKLVEDFSSATDKKDNDHA